MRFKLIIIVLCYTSTGFSFSWFSQAYYHTDSCQAYSNTSYGSLSSVLLLEMNKCYQTSSTSSTLSTCYSELKFTFKAQYNSIKFFSITCKDTTTTVIKTESTFSTDGSCSTTSTAGLLLT